MIIQIYIIFIRYKKSFRFNLFVVYRIITEVYELCAWILQQSVLFALAYPNTIRYKYKAL